jgi:hypothetical protein
MIDEEGVDFNVFPVEQKIEFPLAAVVPASGKNASQGKSVAK